MFSRRRNSAFADAGPEQMDRRHLFGPHYRHQRPASHPSDRTGCEPVRAWGGMALDGDGSS